MNPTAREFNGGSDGINIVLTTEFVLYHRVYLVVHDFLGDVFFHECKLTSTIPNEIIPNKHRALNVKHNHNIKL